MGRVTDCCTGLPTNSPSETIQETELCIACFGHWQVLCVCYGFSLCRNTAFDIKDKCFGGYIIIRLCLY